MNSTESYPSNNTPRISDAAYSADRFLTLNEAQVFGFGSVKTLRMQIKGGKIPAYTVNGKYLMKESDLKAWSEKPLNLPVPTLNEAVELLESLWGRLPAYEQAGLLWTLQRRFDSLPEPQPVSA